MNKRKGHIEAVWGKARKYAQRLLDHHQLPEIEDALMEFAMELTLQDPPPENWREAMR